MDETVRKILAKRRDRLIATILGAKEDFCDDFIPDDSAVEFRKVILDEINDYYDLCSDLLKSIQPETVVLNQYYADKLDEIYDRLVG